MLRARQMVGAIVRAECKEAIYDLLHETAAAASPRTTSRT
jgi:hypothetical protein